MVPVVMMAIERNESAIITTVTQRLARWARHPSVAPEPETYGWADGLRRRWQKLMG